MEEVGALIGARKSSGSKFVVLSVCLHCERQMSAYVSAANNTRDMVGGVLDHRFLLSNNNTFPMHYQRESDGGGAGGVQFTL